MTMTNENYDVWALLVERGLDAGSDLQLFWYEADAIEAARDHLAGSWHVEQLGSRDQVYEAIEATTRFRATKSSSCWPNSR
jgi:hypothetical protein